MRRFTVSLQQRDFTEYLTAANMNFQPKRWSGSDMGGPKDAEIELTGPASALIEALDWLRYGVRIVNSQGTVVWWGLIATIEGKLDSLSFAISLDDIANRIKLIYSYQGPDGQALDGETAWAEDAISIADYGTWEAIKSIGESTVSGANQELATELADYANPMTSEFTIGGQSEQGHITLHCRGWFSTLRAKYFARPDGVEKHTSGDTNTVSLGQKLTANTIAFEPNNDYIHDLNGRMSAFSSGQRIKVSGASNGANNGTFKISRGTNQTALTIISTLIFFDPQDDVMAPDGSTLFTDIDANDLIHISGSRGLDNNGYFFVVESSGSNHLVVDSPDIGAELAGDTITVLRGNAVGIDGGLVKEKPGATVTITVVGEQLAQKFTLTQATGFYLFEGYIRVGKVNLPSDGLILALYTDSAGFPGTMIEEVTVAAANIPTDPDWVACNFTGATFVSPGTFYHLTVRRSGAASYNSYYSIEFDQDGGYANGLMQMWDGAGWVAPETGSDLYFALWGKEQTTTQIQRMVTSGGQFIQSCQILDASGLPTYQYREGDLRTIDEIEGLLRAGSSDSKRLVAEVTEQRHLMISKRPDVSSQSDTVMVTLDNRWMDVAGSKLDEGYLPYGKWVQIRGLPPDVNAATRISPFYVGFAEYDATSGELHCERNSDRAIGDISKVDNG